MERQLELVPRSGLIGSWIIAKYVRHVITVHSFIFIITIVLQIAHSIFMALRYGFDDKSLVGFGDYYILIRRLQG